MRVDKIVKESKFKKGLKKLQKQHRLNVLEELLNVIEDLAEFRIGAQKSNHPLRGRLKKYRDLHLAGGDIVLLYRYERNRLYVSLILHNVGSHDEVLNEGRPFDETFFKSKANRSTHYLGHVNWLDGEGDDELFGLMSPDEYDAAADKLSKEEVQTSDPRGGDDVVGFVGRNGRILKYKKSTGEIVVYVATSQDQSTIAYYKTRKNDPSSYIRKLKRDYWREIAPDDDRYNK